MKPSESSFERRLTDEIMAIDRQVAALVAERDALTRQLLKARTKNPVLRDVTRLNSGQRVIVEQSILDFLKEKSKASSKQIFNFILSTTVSDLNESTFRTYVRRMKDKGLIESKRRGVWEISKEV